MIWLDRTRLVFLWRRGGNWLVFLILWIILAAIIGAIESTTEEHVLTEEAKIKIEVQGMVAGLNEMKAQIEPGESQQHLDKLIQLISREEFPRVWVLGEDKFDEHVEVLRMKLRLMREEFSRVKGKLREDDSAGRTVADQLVSILADNKTLDILDQVAQHRQEAAEEQEEEEEEEHWQQDWQLGDSLHYVSTVFTTIGYGARTPLTPGGKFLTILMVVTLIPFFLHCLCTSASSINNLINRMLGLTEHYDDLEDLTAEKRNDNMALRWQACWKGCLLLCGMVAVHMFISSLYHLATTGWNYSDVLYYEFVNYSTIGFGDLVPEDENSVAGSILKNLLVKIPAAILLLTLFLRILPIIS